MKDKTARPVLINVDDNEPARYARTRILRKAGFEVHDAGTGEDALALVLRVHPDMVLLDVNLPDIHGIEVCRRIKQDPQNTSVIVMQVTASATSAPQATESLNSGADNYLIEPVDPDVLVATVRAMLRLRRAEHEAREANERLNEVNIALQRSNEDLRNFAYIASHDLQEPLRTVATHVQLLERSLTGRLSDTELRSMGFVVEAATRMGVLVADVLSYSEAGNAREHQPVPLNEAVGWALTNLSESILSVAGNVKVEELPQVFGDSVQLSQLFQNLIGNALKYRAADRPPDVHIGIRSRAGDQCVIFVRDNGPGIDARHHERVFRAFERLHGRDIPGTGIGLAMCRRIVEAHGGRIWLESEVEQGACFVFTLKAVEVSVSASQT